MQQATTMVHGTVDMPTLAVTENPTSEQLQVWWETMQSDDLRVAYADSFPPTLQDFCCEVAAGEKHCLLCLVNGEVAGAVWLHDVLHREDGTLSTGWLGCYFLAPYRGRVALHLWHAARQYWEAMGVEHFFTAVHAANRLSQAFVARGACFHRVGKYPDFTIFQGQPVDVFIYSMRAEDAPLAWELAEARAARQMLCAAL